MEVINRSAIIVMPAQPFLDWLHRVDPTSADLTLADLRREPTIYLLPEYDRGEPQPSNACKRSSAKSSRNNSPAGTASPRLGRGSAISAPFSAGSSIAAIPWSLILARI